MATAKQLHQLNEAITSVMLFAEKDMLKRSEWGAINFQGTEEDQRIVFDLFRDLQNMPLECLTDTACSQITAPISEVVEYLQQIDKFSLEQQNPTAARDDIAQQLHDAIDNLHAQAAPWIPYLAYRRGDISKNLDQLRDTIDQANRLYDETKTWAETKRADIETVSKAAREAAASAGAAVFSTSFTDAAMRQRILAFKWLLGTAGFATLTLIAAIASFWWPPWPDNASTTLGNILPRLTTKIAGVGILFTATVWCGRVYRALLHQASVNERRGLSIATLQAFVSASNDLRTRDAVLLEATRSVFARAPTGYVDEQGRSYGEGVQFVEIGKAVADAKSRGEN